jgi:hypothetical protein
MSARAQPKMLTCLAASEHVFTTCIPAGRGSCRLHAVQGSALAWLLLVLLTVMLAACLTAACPAGASKTSIHACADHFKVELLLANNETVAMYAVQDADDPGRDSGSCCSSDWQCSSNTNKETCAAAGGEWRSSLDACSTRLFCAGACCTAGGTSAAACRITKKAECVGAGGSWVPDGDCNDPNFCPKVSVCHGCCGSSRCMMDDDRQSHMMDLLTVQLRKTCSAGTQTAAIISEVVCVTGSSSCTCSLGSSA